MATIADKKYIISRKKDSMFELEVHSSALINTVVKTNHSIDWVEVRLLMKEAIWATCGIKEVITIRKLGLTP